MMNTRDIAAIARKNAEIARLREIVAAADRLRSSAFIVIDMHNNTADRDDLEKEIAAYDSIRQSAPPSLPDTDPDSLLVLQREITAWATKTFGEHPITATVAKLRTEVAELITLPWGDPAINSSEVQDELADVLHLLVQLAERTGVDLLAATRDKFARNKARRWTPQPDGTFGHVPSTYEEALERLTVADSPQLESRPEVDDDLASE